MISMLWFALLALAGLVWGSAPRAWVLDPDPWDPGALYEYLERVAHEGAAVRRFADGYLVIGATARQQELARAMGLSGRLLPDPAGEQRLVTEFRAPAGVQGDGAVLRLEHRENATFTATSFLLDRRETVRWARDGAVIVDSPYAGGNTARARNFAEQFGLRVTATDAPPTPAFELHRPRVAVVRSNEDAHWLEWVLNEYKVPFTEVTSIPAGRFDSVVLAGAASLDAASMGTFVRGGGTLVATGGAAAFAIRVLALPVSTTRLAEGVARFDVTHPVAFGMPASAAVSGTGISFEAQGEARAIAWVGDAPVVLEYPLGRGRVLLFGFEPQFRGEAYGTFRLLLNAVYWASAQPL